jgi:hypothetical protein
MFNDYNHWSRIRLGIVMSHEILPKVTPQSAWNDIKTAKKSKLRLMVIITTYIRSKRCEYLENKK